MMNRYVNFFVGLSMVCLMAGACSSGGSVKPTEKRSNVEIIMQSIVDGDAKQLASLTHFPIVRAYPLKNIENEQQLEVYFDTLFDDHFRQLMSQADENDWDSVGWRGQMFADGLLWVYDSLTAVNYYSELELRLKQQLAEQEMNSLHPSLWGNWRPYGCYVDEKDGSVLRVDVGDDGVCRLSVYHCGTKLSDRPDILVTGHMEIRGSIGVVYHHYESREGCEMVLDEYECRLMMGEDGAQVHRLRPCYWRDVFKGNITHVY